jgi:AbrB family looped-hinge helix DNA binding protein
MPTAKLTSKGQITIPRAVRETLGVKTGDRLVFEISPKGRVTVTAEERPPATPLLGRLSRYRKPSAVSVEELNEAIVRRASERHRGVGRRGA